MAADYTVINRTGRTQLATQAIRLANLLREVRDLADALNDVASHMHDGANFDMVEEQFSLEDPTIGGNFVTRLQQLQDILNTNTDVTGANRLSQLNEFVDRLAGQ